MATQGDALGYALMPFQGVSMQGVNGYVVCIYIQGVASLALGYALMPFQGVSMRLCPFGAHVHAFNG